MSDMRTSDLPINEKIENLLLYIIAECEEPLITSAARKLRDLLANSLVLEEVKSGRPPELKPYLCWVKGIFTGEYRFLVLDYMGKCPPWPDGVKVLNAYGPLSEGVER